MPVEIIDTIMQGEPEWFQARLGMPTASKFGTIMAQGKGGAESKTRTKLLYQLAGERITGIPTEDYKNSYMDRGTLMEAEARKYYALMYEYDGDLREVGFVKNGKFGCSPDSLIGDDGMLEIKTAAPHVLIDILKQSKFPAFRNWYPPEHKAQLQGNLWVAERKWIDLLIFYSKMPVFKVRVERDEDYIQNMKEQCELFELELRRLVDELKAM